MEVYRLRVRLTTPRNIVLLDFTKEDGIEDEIESQLETDIIFKVNDLVKFIIALKDNQQECAREGATGEFRLERGQLVNGQFAISDLVELLTIP